MVNRVEAHPAILTGAIHHFVVSGLDSQALVLVWRASHFVQKVSRGAAVAEGIGTQLQERFARVVTKEFLCPFHRRLICLTVLAIRLLVSGKPSRRFKGPKAQKVVRRCSRLSLALRTQFAFPRRWVSGRLSLALAHSAARVACCPLREWV